MSVFGKVTGVHAELHDMQTRPFSQNTLKYGGKENANLKSLEVT